MNFWVMHYLNSLLMSVKGKYIILNYEVHLYNFD